MAVDDNVNDMADRYDAFFPTTCGGRQTSSNYIVQCSDGPHAECVEDVLNAQHGSVLHAKLLRNASSQTTVVLSYRGEDGFPREFLPAIAATVLKYDDGAVARLPLERRAVAKPV